MSKVKRSKVNASAAELIASVDDDRSGSSLLSPLRLETYLEDITLWMQGPMSMETDNGFVDVPRFGVLSLILQTTPCYVYGHPALKKISRTAFTDGIHVFICDDFFDTLNKESEETGGREMGIVPLLLHELMHKMLRHVGRLRGFPADISNIATDRYINSNLAIGFPEVKWVASLRENGLAFRPGEQEKYAKLSEEAIARELMVERLRKDPPKKGGKSQANSDQGPSSGQSGQGQPGQSGQPGPGGDKSRKGQKGQPGNDETSASSEAGEDDLPSDQFGDDDDNHMVSPEDLIKVLEENGLDSVRDKLGYPDSTDLEKIGEIQEADQLRQTEAIQRAQVQMNAVGGNYPGAHIATAAAEMVSANARGKLTWRLALRDMVLGQGQRFRPSMEEPSDIYHVEEMDSVLGTRLWLPIEMSHKNDEVVLFLFDTSGSVGSRDLEEGLAEAIELKTASSGFSDTASEVVILSADTVIRGEPVEINENNVQDVIARGVNMHGRGGTDFVTPLKQALSLPMFKEKKIRSIVYFTDLYAPAPSAKEIGLPSDCSMLYLVAPSTARSNIQHAEVFAKEVESYARVIEIREGAEAVLGEEYLQQDVSPRRRSRRP